MHPILSESRGCFPYSLYACRQQICERRRAASGTPVCEAALKRCEAGTTNRGRSPAFTQTEAESQPLFACHRSLLYPLCPVAYDCAKVLIIRRGSALVYREGAEHSVRVGDVVLVGPNAQCGIIPRGPVRLSVISIDAGFLLSQMLCRHAGLLDDCYAVQESAEAVFAIPVQVLCLGVERIGAFADWVDELVMLSVEGAYRVRFHRMLALWHLLMDALMPFVQLTSIPTPCRTAARIKPCLPQKRVSSMVRTEANRTRNLLRSDLSRGWTLSELAAAVHLSGKQLSRVFVDAYGKTPLAYLTMLRVDAMAMLIRDANMTVEEAGRRVGWASRSRAAEAFREHTGMSATRYRQMLTRDEQSGKRTSA